jgi:hypothetical protein
MNERITVELAPSGSTPSEEAATLLDLLDLGAKWEAEDAQRKAA